MKIQCCVCERVRVNGKWMDHSSDQGDQVSHTYCPACLQASVERMFSEMHTMRANTQNASIAAAV